MIMNAPFAQRPNAQRPHFQTQDIISILDCAKTANYLNHYQRKLQRAATATRGYEDTVSQSGELIVTTELED